MKSVVFEKDKDTRQAFNPMHIKSVRQIKTYGPEESWSVITEIVNDSPIVEVYYDKNEADAEFTRIMNCINSI